MWRLADPSEDDVIVAMCLALNGEDPGEPVEATQVRRTLATFRAEPVRGRALVATDGECVVGYALLVSFWSNEYGGEIVAIDELYVVPAHRAQGLGTRLLETVAEDRALWPRAPVALELEVTPRNARARALYERLGFTTRNVLMRRRLAEGAAVAGLALALSLTLLGACSSSPDAAADAGDAAIDSSAPEAGPDGGLDASAPDAGTPTVDRDCTTDGCLRSLEHVGDFGRAALEPYLEADVEIDNGYSVYWIEYVTDGRTSLANVTIPYGVDAPDQGWAVVANLHGTTGLDDACSLTETVAGAGLSGLFGARGMIGVAPDYPGLGTPGLHPYLVAVVEGRAALDALRATTAVAAIVGAPTSGRVAVAGLSQGGHAALAAGAQHSTWAPELDLAAIAAAGPATVWEEHWRLGLALDGPHIAYHAMAVYAWAAFYGHDGGQLWTDAVEPVIDDVFASRCIFAWREGDPTIADELPEHAADLFAPTFLAAYTSGQWGAEYATFGDAFDANRVVPFTQTAPIAIWQGDADDTVPVASTTEVVDALEAGGMEIDYRIVPGGGHVDVAFGFVAEAQLRTEETIEWLRARLAE